MSPAKKHMKFKIPQICIDIKNINTLGSALFSDQRKTYKFGINFLKAKDHSKVTLDFEKNLFYNKLKNVYTQAFLLKNRYNTFWSPCISEA